jgi:hypothetical protein
MYTSDLDYGAKKLRYATHGIEYDDPHCPHIMTGSPDHSRAIHCVS